MRFRLSTALLLLPVVVAACSDDDDPTDPSLVLEGTYVATQFLVTPIGLPTVDVLASGGSVTITIAGDGTTSGTATVPASITGTGQAATLDMAGTAVRSGNTVTFQQAEDSFVEDVEWTLDAVGLHTSSQVAGLATFTIRLTRQ